MPSTWRAARAADWSLLVPEQCLLFDVRGQAVAQQQLCRHERGNINVHAELPWQVRHVDV